MYGAPTFHMSIVVEHQDGPFKILVMGGSDAFEVVVLGEDCPRPKPHPDPYQKALETLGLSPHEAIVIEDSPSGAVPHRRRVHNREQMNKQKPSAWCSGEEAVVDTQKCISWSSKACFFGGCICR